MTGWSGPAAAQTTQAPEGEKLPSTYDKIWKFAELYKNEANPVIQKILFTGRYQHEYAELEAGQFDLDEWNLRRMRVGSKVTLLRTFTLHAEVELNPQERDPLYQRFTDLYLQWSRSGRFVVTLGKHGVLFTMDGSTSSKDLLTIDRSNLANNIWFPQEYMPGIAVSGRRAPWVYRAGVYTAGEGNREFGRLNGGMFALGVVGYDFADFLGAKEALLAGNYVTASRSKQHVHAAPGAHRVHQFQVRAEHVGCADGYVGRHGIPWTKRFVGLDGDAVCVNVTGKLQFVGRADTFLESPGTDGVRFGTYESRLMHTAVAIGKTSSLSWRQLLLLRT